LYHLGYGEQAWLFEFTLVAGRKNEGKQKTAATNNNNHDGGKKKGEGGWGINRRWEGILLSKSPLRQAFLRRDASG